MPLLNRLSEDELRGSEGLFGRLLIIIGFTVSLAILVDPAGWDDPVFDTLRKVPYTPYSWAGGLLVCTLVYMVGEVVNAERKWRGGLLITGATLCGMWWAIVALAMSRQVYLMPTRITDLWPIVTFTIACLYGMRIIVYGNAFTGYRWNTNPYQLWGTSFLLLASLSEVVLGIVPSSVLVEVERPVAFQLALINLFGACVVMFGLHMRNREAGLNLELAGASSLAITIVWYCLTVLHKTPMAGTTIGFALTEGFTFGTFHRAMQILTLKYARWRDHPTLEKRMKSALTFEPPRHVK
jgi:hypothetical protein